MKSPICDQLGIEFPLIAFTHCRDVVCEVSRAGGMGVGLMNQSTSSRQVVYDFMEDFLLANERLNGFIEE